MEHKAPHIIENKQTKRMKSKDCSREETCLCGLSPPKDRAGPVNATAITTAPRPIPAHKSHPFCRLKGSLKSETREDNTISKDQAYVSKTHSLTNYKSYVVAKDEFYHLNLLPH